MAFTRKKMTEHTPKSERPSDVDWTKIAPDMVHVDHARSEKPSPHLSVIVTDLGEGQSDPANFPREAMNSATSDMVHVDHVARVDSPSSEADRIVHLPVGQVVPNPRQPRSHFDEDELADLASSIAETGVLQPIVVREAGDHRWELIMGERRLRASRLAGRETIPALVRQVPDDQLLKEAIIENVQRAALNPLEEALALQALLDDWGVSQEEVGKAVGKSRIAVSHTIALLRLPDEVQRRVASGVISRGHAKVLMGIENKDIVQILADRVIAESMSVRGLEEAVLLMDLTEQKKPRRGRSARRRVTYPEVAEAFEIKLDTRVRVEGSSRRGRVIIEFGGADDLDRICEILEVRRDGSIRD